LGVCGRRWSEYLKTGKRKDRRAAAQHLALTEKKGKKGKWCNSHRDGISEKNGIDKQKNKTEE